jgi:hypothetical protein
MGPPYCQRQQLCTNTGKKYESIKKHAPDPGMVAHAHDPSYLKGRDRRIMIQGQPANSQQGPISKNKTGEYEVGPCKRYRSYQKAN